MFSASLAVFALNVLYPTKVISLQAEMPHIPGISDSQAAIFPGEIFFIVIFFCEEKNLTNSLVVNAFYDI